MNRQCCIFLATFLLVGCSSVPTENRPPDPVDKVAVVTPKAPKVALVLGGGAARGFAHIGVIQALEESGIPIDMVVGTSAGSVVAALHASGKSGTELQRIALSMEEASFSDWRLPLFTPGVIKGEALARFIRAQVDAKQIQDLPIRLGIVATDLQSGQGILFQRGDVAMAVRASSAIPAVFQPVSISGHEYVDGGLVAPVPVSYARQMGAEVIIAVDISAAPQANASQDSFQILMKTFAIMGSSINRFELRDADVVVKPSLQGLSSTSFSSRKEAITAGYQSMLSMLGKLRNVIQTKRR
nr:patatin-like phospholipase family protein [uncultured Rhodoferax sp.]